MEQFCSLIESGGAAREAIKQAYARSIEKELRTAFEQSKAYDCDPFFLKRDLYRFAPDKYDGDYDLDDLEVEYKNTHRHSIKYRS